MSENLNEDEAYSNVMKIYAICTDADIDDDKTRVLSYIHSKISGNGNDIDYFGKAADHDCIAIEAMLGNMAPLRAQSSRALINDADRGRFDAYCENISESIRSLDASLHETNGMENRLSGELRNRLRLYRDTKFRDEMVRLYRELIIPRMGLYETPTINRAFRMARAKYRQSSSIAD